MYTCKVWQPIADQDKKDCGSEWQHTIKSSTITREGKNKRTIRNLTQRNDLTETCRKPDRAAEVILLTHLWVDKKAMMRLGLFPLMHSTSPVFYPYPPGNMPQLSGNTYTSGFSNRQTITLMSGARPALTTLGERYPRGAIEVTGKAHPFCR